VVNRHTNGRTDGQRVQCGLLGRPRDSGDDDDDDNNADNLTYFTAAVTMKQRLLNV